MMYESRRQPMVPRHIFVRRFLRNLLFGLLITLLSLGLGMWGYHHYEKLDWLDSYVNAAMILSGMGPLKNPETTGGKLFAGTYALFSGIVFLIVVGIIFAPVFHRLIHQFHVEEDTAKKSK